MCQFKEFSKDKSASIAEKHILSAWSEIYIPLPKMWDGKRMLPLNHSQLIHRAEGNIPTPYSQFV